MGFLALKDLQAAGDLPQGPPWRHDSHLAILFWLAKHQNDTQGWAWPSIETLARLTKKSKRQVIRIIQELEADRLVEVNRHGHRNRYRLTIPTKAQLARQATLERMAQPPVGDTHVTNYGDTGVTLSPNTVTSAAEMVTSARDMVTPVTRLGDTAMSPELKERTELKGEPRGAAALPPSTRAETGLGVSPSPEQRQHLESIRRTLGLVKVG